MPKRRETPVLSLRQFDCLQGVADHLASEQIADRLGISPHTVNSHLTAAMSALGAASRREAVRKYLDLQAKHPEKLTGQFLRVAAEPFATPSPSLPTEVRESPADAWLSPTLPAVDSGRNGDGLGFNLNTIAQVIGVAAGLILLLIAVEPLAESAMHLANMIQPFHQR